MFKIKKRCFRCLHVLREDGTCQNPKCSRYVAEEDTSETEETPKASNKSDTNDTSGSESK